MKPVLDFVSDEGKTSIQRFLWLILYAAVQDKADQIVLELTPRTTGRLACERSELPVELGVSEEIRIMLNKFDAAETEEFRIVFVGPKGAESQKPAFGSIYRPVMNCLFNFTRHPFWKPGPVRAELWLENPHATFLVTTEDWHRKVVLTRVEERLESAGEPGDDDTLLPPVPAEPATRWVFRACDLPELQEVEPSQRVRRWRDFCHSRRMLPLTICRALCGAGLVSFVFWATVSTVQQRELALHVGLLGAGLAAALHQALHFHSLRPSLREWLQSRSEQKGGVSLNGAG